jgi:hypothetical protein
MILNISKIMKSQNGIEVFIKDNYDFDKYFEFLKCIILVINSKP